MGCRRRFRRGLPWAAAVLVTSCLLLWSKNDGRASSAAGDDRRRVSVRLKNDQQEFIDHRGLHVVVGHYLGDVNNVGTSVNLTDELLNRNMFDPKPKEGRDGTPVIIPPHMSSQMQKLYRINRFNLMASDRIPLNRSLPDVRKKSCRLKEIDIDGLPSSSVIIVFHNEAWSTLMRTVQSVVDRSPRSLLHEIILVDDASTRRFLERELDDHVARFAVRTRIVRSSKRIGLIKARLVGARQARGDILVFLDAHCECTIGWLEGLVVRVAEDRRRVVCPVIDIISDETFAYVRSFELHWGAFNWDLHFRWYTRAASGGGRPRDVAQAFRTPAMAGGLFAVDRSYFFQLGGYDERMEVWGGENLELSFRVWQCGGSVEIAPCSHVGHVFRKSSPYTFPGGVSRVLYANLARVALVWMDEWQEFYFRFNPEAEKVRDEQQIRTRLELRDRLKCKGFKWYLDNVWPEHFMPTDKRFFGKVKHALYNRCLVRPSARGSLNQPTGPVGTSACDVDGRPSLSLMFVMAPDEGLDSAVWSGPLMTDESVCVDTPELDAADGDIALKVRVVPCTGRERQRWKYDAETTSLVHLHTGLCLDLPAAESSIVLKGCANHASQKWIFEQIPWR